METRTSHFDIFDIIRRSLDLVFFSLSITTFHPFSYHYSSHILFSRVLGNISVSHKYAALLEFRNMLAIILPILMEWKACFRFYHSVEYSGSLYRNKL